MSGDNFSLVMRGMPVERDLVCDGWTLIGRSIGAQIAALAEEERTPERIGQLHELADFRHMSRIRDRVDQVVVRPEVAEKLKSWYRWMCKRPTFHDDYLPTFNRPNVTLVDVSATRGVERVTETGVVANGEEYQLDCLIYASGFEITSEMRRRIGIAVVEGRDGLSLYDHLQDGFRTLHGLMAHGFPNMFFTGFIQGGISASVTEMYDVQTGHIAHIIRQTLDRGATVVEPTEQAQDGWVRTIHETAISMQAFLAECTPGYYNNEGGSVMRSHLGDVYEPGFHAFAELLADWRDNGALEGLVLTT